MSVGRFFRSINLCHAKRVDTTNIMVPVAYAGHEKRPVTPARCLGVAGQYASAGDR
jgi:hypothetical protein